MNISKNESDYTLVKILVALIVIFGGIGWVLNIAKIVIALEETNTGLIFLRIFGVFLAPLGAILGYM